VKYQIWSNIAYGRADRFIDGYHAADKMLMSWEGEVHPNLRSLSVHAILESVFMAFNADDRPNGKIAHSLSMGDVVVLDGAAYKVSMVGFVKLAEFTPWIDGPRPVGGVQ
jgi:hypothetical protein